MPRSAGLVREDAKREAVVEAPKVLVVGHANGRAAGGGLQLRQPLRWRDWRVEAGVGPCRDNVRIAEVLVGDPRDVLVRKHLPGGGVVLAASGREDARAVGRSAPGERLSTGYSGPGVHSSG